jgi:pyruvate,water dikinase
MFNKLSSDGIKVPGGFATTAWSFDYFLGYNKLKEPLALLMKQLNKQDYSNLKEIGGKARELFHRASLPDRLKKEILTSYTELGNGSFLPVAVRNS